MIRIKPLSLIEKTEMEKIVVPESEKNEVLLLLPRKYEKCVCFNLLLRNICALESN